MEITIEILEINDQQYFGSYKFYTFVDKLRVKLIYEKKKQKWEYLGLVKLYDEPRVGQN